MNTSPQADMSQGINPAFLAGGFSNVNSSSNATPHASLSPQQIQQMHAMRSMGGGGGQGSAGGMGISPAMFQQGGGAGGTMNPAALMNGMGGMGGMSGMNGRMAQFQQMQAQAQAQRMGMNMNMGMGGGGMGMGGGGSGGGSMGMGMNPAQLLHQQQQQQMNLGGGSGMGGVNPAALGGMGSGGMNMMGGMGNMGGMGMGGMSSMSGMNMGMGIPSSMTSPTSGSSALPNVSGHGMSQSSPTVPTPSTPNLSMQQGSSGGFPSAAQMQHLAQMNPQMKALQMQRAAMAAQMQGMQGTNMGLNMGGGMGMNMGGMSGMTPAQMQQMQMLQQQQQQQAQNQAQMQRPPSSASFSTHAHRLSQGQLQTSPTPTPGPGGQSQGGGTPHAPQPLSGGGAGMMPPPSSIPPRPPTASSHHGQGMHSHAQQQQQQQHGFQQFPTPSPRPGTASGSRPGTSQNQAGQPSPSNGGQGQQQGQVQGLAQSQAHTPGHGSPSSPAAPLPVPYGTVPQSPAGVPQRPSTRQSMSGGEAQGQGQVQNKVPSRPSTATGHGPPQTPRQHAQQLQQQLQQQQQQQHHHQQAKMSPTQQSTAGFTPIAPAPVPTGGGATQVPNSPQVGGKRRASGTPAPGAGSHAPKPSTPAPPSTVGATPNPASSVGTPAPAQMMRTTSSTGIAGMGITGNLGPPPGSVQSTQAVGPGSLMGGAGGGMMPPPVLPRSAQAEAASVPVPGMPGMVGRVGMPGQVAGGALSSSLNVNAPLIPGLGVASVASGAVTGGGPVGMTSPTHVNATAANLGVGVDGNPPIPVPQTPARQPSLPPAAGSPFQSLSSPITGGPIPGSIGGGVPPNAATGTAATVNANGKPASAGSPAPAQAPTTKIIPQLPPLPTTVKLDPKVTRVSVVPLVDSDKVIPQLTAEEIQNVQEWMKADKEYDARYKTMRERMTEEIKSTVSAPRAWWEKDFSLDGAAAVAVQDERRRRQEKFVLTGLKQAKEREMRDRKRAGKREGLRLPRRIPDEDAKRPEQLVPIRLEFDVEHHKMRDTFVWNLSDPIITPEIFAQSIVDDYGLAPSYHAVITKSIQEQLSDYKAHSATFGDDGVMIEEEEEVIRGKITEEEAAWWEAWRKRVRSKALYKMTAPPENRSRKRRKVVKEEPTERPDVAGDAPMTVDDFDEDESLMHEEMRILVKLDIIVGSVKLEDQFEWDLENQDPTPEQFAEIYCKDLGLGGEFKTAIAHSIREQVQIYQKSLFLVGHPSDGSAVQDDDLRMSLLPSLVSGARSMEQVDAFTPVLQYLSESEIEKNEKDREKELARRKRKTTRGRRGVALPDREPPKTFRTPAIGFPEVSPAALALAAAAAAPTSRRAAAAAASLTIANMVASENGTTIIPQTPAAPLTPIASTPATKEKKPKGLFKPPPYPASVLRPRANVKMPTPSTAADISTLPPPLEDDLPAPSSSGIDRQGSKVVLTAKRTKEREREAKEKEYADGQHANMIDGVWHCSNCGCPESIAIGRRKGPLGDKSQCGTCGKYWHRHRRPRPVVYNSSAEYHLGLLRAEEQAKSSSKRKRPQSTVADEPPKPPAAEEDGDAETPSLVKPKSEPDQQAIAQDERPSAVPEGPDRATSPVSTASSTSESPLAHRVKVNGGGHSKSAPPAPPDGEQSSKSESVGTQAHAASPPRATPARSAPSAPPAQNPPLPTPQWLTDCLAAMQAKYPDDIFEAVIRKNATSGVYEFRIKCADCPGKHYTPGPGETLQNFEVHLKNRQHRSKVNTRVHPPVPS
ncbi:hypothetical protein BD414DRAFT_413161 [Trametes punicea]|nr:hypothetical protein BD414DRAFT_413161 [Trametes punicea]